MFHFYEAQWCSCLCYLMNWGSSFRTQWSCLSIFVLKSKNKLYINITSLCVSQATLLLFLWNGREISSTKTVDIYRKNLYHIWFINATFTDNILHLFRTHNGKYICPVLNKCKKSWALIRSDITLFCLGYRIAYMYILYDP